MCGCVLGPWLGLRDVVGGLRGLISIDTLRRGGGCYRTGCSGGLVPVGMEWRLNVGSHRLSDYSNARWQCLGAAVVLGGD